MYLVTENYRKKYGLSRQEYLQLDKKYRILNYIYEISDELNAIKVMKWSKES